MYAIEDPVLAAGQASIRLDTYGPDRFSEHIAAASLLFPPRSNRRLAVAFARHVQPLIGQWQDLVSIKVHDLTGYLAKAEAASEGQDETMRNLDDARAQLSPVVAWYERTARAAELESIDRCAKYAMACAIRAVWVTLEPDAKDAMQEASFESIFAVGSAAVARLPVLASAGEKNATRWIAEIDEFRWQVDQIKQEILRLEARNTATPIGYRHEDRVGAGSKLYTQFHGMLMGNVRLDEVNKIRREFGFAHLSSKISDDEFAELEQVASDVYSLLRLEDASLPPFTARTLKSQESLDLWIQELGETDDWSFFRSGYARLWKAYRGGHVSAFDTVTLQDMCWSIFRQFFAKDHPGAFGMIIGPDARVAGKT